MLLPSLEHWKLRPALDFQHLSLNLIKDKAIQTFKMNSVVDPKRHDKVNRYKSPINQGQGAAGDDLMPDYMNILGMIFSMCGLMMKLKWCAWFALYCSCISFANSRVSDDAKQVLSSFMLSVSAVVMSYLQNPAPMSPPWST